MQLVLMKLILKMIKNWLVKAIIALIIILNSCERVCYYPKLWRVSIPGHTEKPGKDVSLVQNGRPVVYSAI